MSMARSSCKFVLVVLGLMLAFAHCAKAATVQFGVERATTALGTIEGVRVRMDWPDRAAQGALELKARIVDAGALGYRFREVSWRCALEPVAQGWRCAGPVHARGAARSTLIAEWQAGILRVSLGGASGSLAVEFPLAVDGVVRVRGKRMPVAWLQSLLATQWADGRLTSGTLDADLAIRARDAGGSEMVGPVVFDDLGLDSVDGRIAAAGLSARTDMNLGFLPDATRLDLGAQLGRGEVLMGAMYVSLPDTPTSLAVSLQSQADSRWELQRFHWRDAGVLELQAKGILDASGGSPLVRLDADFSMGKVDVALARYLASLLGTLGLPGLEGKGSLSGRLEWREAAPTQVEVAARALDLRDGADRFAAQGVEGELRWSAQADVESELRWQHAKVHGIAFGPTSLPWRSRQAELSLRAPAVLPLFDGSLQVDRFAWQPSGGATQGTAMDLALNLSRVDLGKLSRALGWPAFAGSLSGRIPGARYADEVLALEGGLDVEVFDGKLRIDAMTLERPLGVAPTLTAEVALQRLDLQPLTAAFGFGEITGRLEGRIAGLRVVDWSPVAFDADFHTMDGVKGPRRISQRAVNDLTRVGSGGLVAGLQAQALKLFDTFGYSRIGLKCRLANNVCRMDGVDSSGAGYTIVEGSGLPRITVIGHQREVDWPVLVARLKAATQGQVPIVD
ncbi:MAG: YdbH domain-containing protein [Chiayiivirga sp.]|jgi:hypothetical protein|uniref:hypothetical protein n=1 Tax=Chiayiivirga sp. TaxID=2041042 RepID=UPI0025C2FEAE|nr:hypothetical protein [Chiayiivirga sp.]MCI1730292.1 YdbH domain-containing protein [Chiayiivirga sp.]